MPAFNWIQFLELAKHLFSHKSLSDNDYNIMEQAVFRTIISRSYYAIFKVIEDELDKRISYKNYQYQKKSGSHNTVIDYLKIFDQKFSFKLKRLKNQRIIADYKSKQLVSQKDAENALINAENLFIQWPSVLQKIPQ